MLMGIHRMPGAIGDFYRIKSNIIFISIISSYHDSTVSMKTSTLMLKMEVEEYRRDDEHQQRSSFDWQMNGCDELDKQSTNDVHHENSLMDCHVHSTHRKTSQWRRIDPKHRNSLLKIGFVVVVHSAHVDLLFDHALMFLLLDFSSHDSNLIER